QAEVEDHQIRPLAIERLDRAAPGFDGVHAVPARAQQRRHRPLNRFLVVDEEDQCGSHAPLTAIVNTAPPSGWFSAHTRPSCTTSRPRVMARPSPDPNGCCTLSTPR